MPASSAVSTTPNTSPSERSHKRGHDRRNRLHDRLPACQPPQVPGAHAVRRSRPCRRGQGGSGRGRSTRGRVVRRPAPPDAISGARSALCAVRVRAHVPGAAPDADACPVGNASRCTSPTPTLIPTSGHRPGRHDEALRHVWPGLGEHYDLAVETLTRLWAQGIGLTVPDVGVSQMAAASLQGSPGLPEYRNKSSRAAMTRRPRRGMSCRPWRGQRSLMRWPVHDLPSNRLVHLLRSQQRTVRETAAPDAAVRTLSAAAATSSGTSPMTIRSSAPKVK